MKIIKLAILSVIFLFAVVLIISLFIPSHIRISRAVNLKPTADSVLTKINDINSWKEWYPGFDTMIIEPVLAKDSRLISAKIQNTTTVTIISNKKDEVQAEFKSGRKEPVIGGWKMLAYNQSDSLTLQWYFDFKIKWYPWEKFFSLAYDKMYGTQMEAGLTNLKKIAER